jgi:hypothetical protein
MAFRPLAFPKTHFEHSESCLRYAAKSSANVGTLDHSTSVRRMHTGHKHDIQTDYSLPVSRRTPGKSAMPTPARTSPI